MRKLNTKNKTYILALSTLVVLVFAGVIVFIVYKFKDLNIKYPIQGNSVFYSDENELITLKSDSYAKKNFFGSYYAMMDNEKIGIGLSPVIYNKDDNSIMMLGNFFEILPSGEVNKLKGITTIDDASVSRIYKIEDRKYLVIASKIISKDGSLDAKNYLLIDIDKKGNAYLYNNELNIKTFNELEIVTPDFNFKVSEEKLIRDDEEIDLAKINGSTNEFVPSPDEPEPDPSEKDGTGTGDGSGSGGGSGSGNAPVMPQTPSENIYPEGEKVIITGTEVEERYIARKTTIIGLDTTTTDIKINYIVYDPFDEFKNLYVTVLEGGSEVGTYDMDLNLTNHTLSGLKAATTYELQFYYTYTDEGGTEQKVLFDTLKATTKNINASISLEKTSSNSVRYIVKVEGGYVLDSAKVALYIDGEFVTDSSIDTLKATSTEGFRGEITFDKLGDFALLKLTDCRYNGMAIDVSANYKYKL